MSGFFSLGGKEQEQQQNQQADTNYSLFQLNKNEEIYSKGFELWQQNYQQRHQSQLHQDVEFSIGPSSSTRRNNSNNIVGGNIGNEPPNYSYRSAGLGFQVMNQGRGGNVDGLNCQDCGNQAKKDCEHMRCRTCCKSRGFPCQTHVRSTWVPAAKRRERQQQVGNSSQQDQQQMVIRGENSKRLKESAGGGCGSGGGFEVGHFPAEVNSPAVFRCVRVSSMDDADEHLAYQTAVNIGGHVFKGILYDQGSENRYPGGGGEGPSDQSHQQRLDLIASSAAATTTSNPNLAMLDPSINYPPQLSGYMAGTQFFLPPRP